MKRTYVSTSPGTDAPVDNSAPFFKPDASQDTPRPLFVSPHDHYKKRESLSITSDLDGSRPNSTDPLPLTLERPDSAATDRRPSAESQARAWARATGLDVPATGRVPVAVLTAYRRAGSPPPPVTLCGEPGCTAPARSQSAPPLCSRCYQRRKRHGQLPQARRARPEQSPAWKDDRIGYWGAHERINTAHGRAALYTCNNCSNRAEQWALMPDTAQRLSDPDTRQEYSPDPGDYRPMCRRCHHRMDECWRALHRQPPRGMLQAEFWPAPVLPVVPRLPLHRFPAQGSQS